MVKIATHDSATGEKVANLLSWLMLPFSRTQSKSIIKQFKHGCRCFDIRVKKYKGEWHCAHGLFKTKKTAWEIFDDLNFIAASDTENPTFVNVVYEGKLKDYTEFYEFAQQLMKSYTNIQFGDFFSKYPSWNKVIDGNQTTFYPPNKNYKLYKSLDFSSWHTLIPIPILWKLFYFKHPVFNEESFTYVDFL